jgi:hypothetical protein
MISIDWLRKSFNYIIHKTITLGERIDSHSGVLRVFVCILSMQVCILRVFYTLLYVQSGGWTVLPCMPYRLMCVCPPDAHLCLPEIFGEFGGCFGYDSCASLGIAPKKSCFLFPWDWIHESVEIIRIVGRYVPLSESSVVISSCAFKRACVGLLFYLRSTFVVICRSRVVVLLWRVLVQNYVRYKVQCVHWYLYHLPVLFLLLPSTMAISHYNSTTYNNWTANNSNTAFIAKLLTLVNGNVVWIFQTGPPPFAAKTDCIPYIITHT